MGTAQQDTHIPSRPAKSRKLHHHQQSSVASDSDSEDDGPGHHGVAPPDPNNEREDMIKRKFSHKWRHAVGLKAHPSTIAAKGEESGVHWTKGICPRTEGRITMVGPAS